MAGLLTAVVAVVLALTGPVLVVGAPMTTEPSALKVEATPDYLVTQFVLPLDVPLEEMPFTSVCTEDMHAWLSAHGKERPPAYEMSVRNGADDGPMLTIDNVRVVGKKTIPARPGFLFNCPDAGVGETAVLNLRLDREGPAMLLDEDLVTERPFAFNLEPGEKGAIILQLRGGDQEGYSGRVVADVTGGGDTTRVDLALGESGGRFEHPGLGRASGFTVEPGPTGSFICTWIEPDGAAATEDCDAAQARSAAAALWE
jgi:hypothetical protein